MKQTCKECKWYYWVLITKPPACYQGGKWRKWLKKGSEDKPNDCPNFET